MPMTETQRAAELAARFNASKQRDASAYERLSTSADERRAIVAELLTFMKPPRVAELLGISVTRVYQITGTNK